MYDYSGLMDPPVFNFEYNWMQYFAHNACLLNLIQAHSVLTKGIFTHHRWMHLSGE